MKTILEKDFIDRELSKIPNECQPFLDKDIVKKNLSLAYQEFKFRTENIEFAINFQKFCPTKNGKSEDYLYKIVELDGILFWLSLRFWNLNIDYPYIDILYFNSDISAVTKNFTKYYQDILTLYSNIDVKNIRLTFYYNDFELLNNIEHEVDNIMLGKLLEKKNESTQDKIRIELLQELTFQDYVIYENEYKIFNQEDQNLNFVKSVKYESLQNCIKNGFVYKIYKNQSYIGLYAIVEDFYDIYYGYCVFEKIIFKTFRGQNYSAIAQELIENDLIQKNQSKKTYLLGTISPKNISSFKSAIKSGRKILMKQVMIKPKLSLT